MYITPHDKEITLKTLEKIDFLGSDYGKDLVETIKNFPEEEVAYLPFMGTEVSPWQLVDEIIRTNCMYFSGRLTTISLLKLISNYSYNLERFIYNILIEPSSLNYEALAVKYHLETYKQAKAHLDIAYEPYYSDFYLEDWRVGMTNFMTQVIKNLRWRIDSGKTVIRDDLPTSLSDKEPGNIQVWYQGYGYGGGYNLPLLDSYLRIVHKLRLGRFKNDYFTLARI